MKKVITFIMAIAFTTVAFAQTPQTINYQAVARNNAGQALASQTIKVRLSFVKNNVTSYSETRTVTTNLLGLFNVSIGSAGATNVVGSFGAIDWNFTAAQPVKLKVEIDLSNNGTFTDMGSQDLSTVPYAQVATNTLALQGAPVSTSQPQTGELLKWDGTQWKPATGPKTYPVNGAVNAPIPALQTQYAFQGPLTTITVDGTQTISVIITSALGTSHAPGCYTLFNIGYQNTATNTMSLVSTSLMELVLERRTVAVSAAFTPPAGTYHIGMAVRNTGDAALDQVGWVKGFITVQ